MDRGTNLEALEEEDDEEHWDGGSDSDDDSGGIRKGEPNQFDSLCDGVLATLTLVHASLHELLELKDDLLQHALPPNVLTKVALVTTRVFRSVSDMHMPINELIRMVRLFSTPWEEKSTALKKLHDDYEAKKTQLNIAIKRLQLIDAQSKRIAKERRIMNWEKLFAKLTAAKGHGRRWKFLIQTFKKKVDEGPEQLQRYVDTIDASDDEEDQGDDDMMATQMQRINLDTPTSEHQSKGGEGDSDAEEEEEGESDAASKAFQESEEASEAAASAKTQKVESPIVPVYIKPPMKDFTQWTHEPDFEKFLFVRVYLPEGLDCREIRCVITFGEKIHKTGVLDPLPKTPAENNEGEAPAEDAPEEEETKKKKIIKPRGLIGTKNGADKQDPNKPPPLHSKGDGKQHKGKKLEFEEVIFEVPHVTTKVAGEKSYNGTKLPKDMQIAVHYGPKETLLAMATIEMEDMDSLELPDIHMPPRTGDDLIPAGIPMDQDLEELEGSPKKVFESAVQEALKESPAVKFPLYGLEGGRSDAVPEPLGSLPLQMFFATRPFPFALNRMTETQNMRDIIEDMLGIDINTTSKEDLNKETIERALSAISFTPSQEEPQEETISKSSYDKLIASHNIELEELQREYEARLEILVQGMQQMEEAAQAKEASLQKAQAEALQAQALAAAHAQAQQHMQQQHAQYLRSPGAVHRRSARAAKTPEPPQQVRPQTVEIDVPSASGIKPSEDPSKPLKNFKVGKALPNWGENLPKDFLERLHLFEEEAARHKQQLTEEIKLEIMTEMERKLAGEYKIARQDQMPPDVMQDVSLPAVFLPQKSNNMMIFNPRASKYFHPTGSSGTRLTQPPSMVQLPPLPKSKLSVVNLFDLSNNFKGGGTKDWLMQRYFQQSQASDVNDQATHPANTPMGSYAPPSVPHQSVTPAPSRQPIAEC